MRYIMLIVLLLALSSCARNYSDADNSLALAVSNCQTRMESEATAKYSRLENKTDIMLMAAIDGLIRGQVGYVDPCAQIKTHVHSEIAYAEVQEGIWDGAFSLGKVVSIGVFSYLSLDSLFDTTSAIAAAAGSTFTFQSDGGDISLDDSLNSSRIGNIGDVSDSSFSIFGDSDLNASSTDTSSVTN